MPFSKAGAELLFEVVSRAYERTSLLVTTNLPFAQWTEVLGSERVVGPTDAPGAHPGSQRAELPAARCQGAAEAEVSQTNL